MRLAFLALVCAGLLGCATNPVMSGRPQDWRGHSAEEMRAGLGEPTSIKPQTDGSEIWEYRKSGDFVAPAEENMSFRAGGFSNGGFAGANGKVRTLKSGEHEASYENIWRFQFRNGKVRRWSAARLVDGVTVWSDH